MRKWTVALPWILLCNPGWTAGGHYPVDDAAVTEPGMLALESWVGWQDSSAWEIAAVSMIALRDTVELALGLYRLEDDGDRQTRLEPAVKVLLPWSAGDGAVTTAMSIMAGVNDGRLEVLLWNLPVSAMLSDDLALNVNAGWLRERCSDRWLDRAFLGAGFEWAFMGGIGMIGQVYREGRDTEPAAQLGLRLAGPRRLEVVDLAVGRPLSGPERDWIVTLGAALAF